MINVLLLILGFILGVCYDFVGFNLPIKKNKRVFKINYLTVIVGLLNSCLMIFFYNYYGFVNIDFYK